MNIRQLIMFPLLALAICGCSRKIALQAETATKAEGQETKGLKDYYKDYFDMGVAVSPRALKTDEAGLILREFNSITAENAMKMGPIHPEEGRYNWKDADSIVAFA